LAALICYATWCTITLFTACDALYTYKIHAYVAHVTLIWKNWSI